MNSDINWLRIKYSKWPIDGRFNRSKRNYYSKYRHEDNGDYGGDIDDSQIPKTSSRKISPDVDYFGNKSFNSTLSSGNINNRSMTPIEYSEHVINENHASPTYLMSSQPNPQPNAVHSQVLSNDNYLKSNSNHQNTNVVKEKSVENGELAKESGISQQGIHLNNKENQTQAPASIPTTSNASNNTASASQNTNSLTTPKPVKSTPSNNNRVNPQSNVNEQQETRREKKGCNKKKLLIAILICLCCLLIILALILGLYFGLKSSSSSNSATTVAVTVNIKYLKHILEFLVKI